MCININMNIVEGDNPVPFNSSELIGLYFQSFKMSRCFLKDKFLACLIQISGRGKQTTPGHESCRSTADTWNKRSTDNG